MRTGQEVAAPDLPAGVGRFRRDDDEGREVVILRAQPIADPRTDARAGETERARVHAERGFVVVRVVGFHRADHAQVVHAARDMREERTDLRAAFPVAREVKLRALEEHLVVPFAPLVFVDGSRLPRVGKELRLRVPRIHMRHAAAHVEKDHALRPRGKMRRVRSQRIGAGGGRGLVAEELRKEPRQQHRATRQ